MWSLCLSPHAHMDHTDPIAVGVHAAATSDNRDTSVYPLAFSVVKDILM